MSTLPESAGHPAGNSPPPTLAPGERAEVRLLSRVAAAELSAFEMLYRIYHPRLTRFLDRMTRRPSLVEEVLNDTMMLVWTRAAAYNGRSKVSTWIFGIAYRKALKAISRLDEAVEDADGDTRPGDPAAGPEHQVGLSELHHRLSRALDKLSAEHRAVVELTYFHGLGYREIADVVDCPVDTVKTRMFHARRKLRTLFAGPIDDWL
jgi:RNA polymerase sigma factor (sigma-70 family)